MRPAVTVIVVAYKHAEFVTDALDSIAAQTLPPTRIVVVDDNSPDGTADVAARWLESHVGTAELWRNTANKGLTRNLNEALAAVSTPLYTYMSADDRMHPDRLERQVQAWVDDGERASAVYSNAIRIDGSGQPLSPDYKAMHWPDDLSTLQGHIHSLLLQSNWIPAASVLLHTEAVKAVGGYTEKWFYEDHDLWLRLAACGTFLLVDEPLVDFRELDTSLGHTKFNDRDTDFAASRVGILLDQLGVSAEGDRWARSLLPHRAMVLWRLGAHPELAAAGLRAGMVGPALGLRLRYLLIKLGVTREPAMIGRSASWVHRQRDRRRGHDGAQA